MVGMYWDDLGTENEFRRRGRYAEAMRLPTWATPPQQRMQPLSIGEGMSVERLGFGTWAWGNKLLWGYDPDADGTLQSAFDLIGTPSSPFDNRRFFFDTGDSYGTGALEGRAESLLGKFQRESNAPQRAVVGTKLAIYPTRLTGASFEEACRASLARMGRDELELVQAHWSAANFQPWQEPALWDGLARCYEAGLARSVGTSNFGPEQLAKANAYWRQRGVPHTANQVQFSLLSTLPLESGLFEACDELGVAPIGYSPLALGVLSGKYNAERLPDGPRGLIFKALLPSCLPLLATLREVAAARRVSMSAVAINWAMCKGGVVIVGMRTPEQVKENLGALSFCLSTAECDELEHAASGARKATQNIFQTR
jgi:pyridoxine 4-dehydrogenase